jgi:hypothetical protein
MTDYQGLTPEEILDLAVDGLARTDEELAEEVLARVKAGESVAGALLAVVEEDEAMVAKYSAVARVAAAAAAKADEAVAVARSGHTEIHYCSECGHLECVCDGHDPDDPHSYWKADG